MKICFKDRKLEALCRNYNKLVRVYGQLRATKILQRIDDLNSADCLEDTRNLPGNYHELSQDRNGQWACDLDQPYRLILEPTEKPIPTDESGRHIWTEVRIIDIVEIVNYHGK